MSEFLEGNFITVPNTVDLSAAQYHVVKEDASGNAVLATAATDDILGVLNNAPKAGWGADVAIINGNGTFKVFAGGNITKGAYLTTNGSGQAVVTTNANDRVFGRARAAAVAGDIVEYRRSNERY